MRRQALSCRLIAVGQSAEVSGGLVGRLVVLGALLLVAAGCNQPQAANDSLENQEFTLLRTQESFALSEAENWLFRTPELWTIADEGGRRFLRMSEPSKRAMLAGVRRPQEYAIYTPYELRSFSFSCSVRVERDVATKARDACIIFGRQDDTHFYYVHLAGVSDGVHNTIMRVDGDTRQRLMPDNYRPAPIMTDREWHKVDILRDCDTGSIQVFVDASGENPQPYFEVTDKTYEWGHLAVGSFDDFASFGRILIEGQARKPAVPPSAD